MDPYEIPIFIMKTFRGLPGNKYIAGFVLICQKSPQMTRAGYKPRGIVCSCQLRGISRSGTKINVHLKGEDS